TGERAPRERDGRLVMRHLARDPPDRGNSRQVTTGQMPHYEPAVTFTGCSLASSVNHPRPAAYRTMSTRLRIWSFSIDRVLYVSTVLTDTFRRAAISLFEYPSAIRRTTSRSRSDSSCP